MKKIEKYTIGRFDYLPTYHKVVVQKAYVGTSYTYVMQLLNGQTEVAIFREKRDNNDKQFRNSTRVYWATGSAGGHAQSFNFSGTEKMWLIPTKPNAGGYDIQIARVALPVNSASSKASATSNTSLTRMSHVAQSGGYLVPNSYGTGEGDADRIEFAVSPNKTWFCTLVIKNGKGYFGLYPMQKINEYFESGTFDIRDDGLKKYCVGRFTIDDLTGTSGKIGSVQGFDIDEDLNLYFSSQYASKGADRYITVIPWREDRTENWKRLDLNSVSVLDDKGYYTELEGLQLTNADYFYLTVSYHADSDKKTGYSRIFKVSF